MSRVSTNQNEAPRVTHAHLNLHPSQSPHPICPIHPLLRRHSLFSCTLLSVQKSIHTHLLFKFKSRPNRLLEQGPSSRGPRTCIYVDCVEMSPAQHAKVAKLPRITRRSYVVVGLSETAPASQKTSVEDRFLGEISPTLPGSRLRFGRFTELIWLDS